MIPLRFDVLALVQGANLVDSVLTRQVVVLPEQNNREDDWAAVDQDEHHRGDKVGSCIRICMLEDAQGTVVELQ